MSRYVLAAWAWVACACCWAQAPATRPGNWVGIADEVLKTLEASGRKPAWPGVTAGVAVDRASGDVYMIIPGQGVWKSADHGATFARADQGEVGGRCETGYSINADPAGKRLAFFMLDGRCAITLDSGRSFQRFADLGRNWDYAAVDWSVPQPQAIFAARHESGGEIYTSGDGGKSWTMIGKDPKFSALGLFEGGVLLLSRGDGILRSTDGGRKWEKVSELQPAGRVMAVFNGAGYWVGQDALLISRDKGVTWRKQGSGIEAGWGPWFGKDEKHIMVAGRKGFFETTDAGETWRLAAPLPAAKGFDERRPGWMLNLAWDPVADILYASRMGQGTFKLHRR